MPTIVKQPKTVMSPALVEFFNANSDSYIMSRWWLTLGGISLHKRIFRRFPFKGQCIGEMEPGWIGKANNNGRRRKYAITVLSDECDDFIDETYAIFEAYEEATNEQITIVKWEQIKLKMAHRTQRENPPWCL